MRKGFFILGMSTVILSSCEKTSAVKNNYVDSLITANVDNLIKSEAKLMKVAVVGSKSDTATVKPDSLTWQNELDVFRQIGAFQKHAYRDAYKIEDGLKDPQSNLSVKEYRATSDVPVPIVRFFYYSSLDRLKKIEANVKESNTLYSATRKLVLEFEDRRGKAVLTSYSLNGIQRMILSDSLGYSIEGKIAY